jgi:two-component system nitrogen regulation response regulator NtrX
MSADILIVDDESDIRLLVADILADEGFDCRTAGDSRSAFNAIEERRPNLLILDIWLEDSDADGMEILKRVHAEHSSIPIIMISGHGNVETAVSAIKLGAYDFIEKPFKADRLVLTAKRAIENARLQRENQELRQRTVDVNDMVGTSPAIRQLASALEKVAPTDSRVLISGPAGVGKEVFARQLHSQSLRSSGPFVVLNCAAMNPDRMELELFGAEMPDTGEARNVGILELADSGTLLLDEVSDMPLETQGKIVRVLQDQRFTRISGELSVNVDVRIIASTSRDMDVEMANGKFRQDLFYRLNVVPIEIPPLRGRPDDVPVLVEHFMQRSALISGVSPRDISPQAMAALQAYEWPGNVRQLRNAVDWILIMAPGEADDLVTVENLPQDIRAGSSESASIGWEEGAKVMSLPLRDARENFERQYLLAQVSRFGGSVSRTAEFVGMERSALHRKLKSLGVTSRDTSDPVQTSVYE